NYLHGFTDLLENNDVVIVVAGTDQKIVDNFKNICFAGHEGEKVSHVDEEEWNEPLLIGFETKRDYNLSRKEIQELIQEKIKSSESVIFYEKIIITLEVVGHGV